MQFSKEDILDISKILAASEFANIEVKTDEWEIRIFRDGAVQARASDNGTAVAPAPEPAVPQAQDTRQGAAPKQGTAPTAQTEQEDNNTALVRSPILGTFYESPQPGAAPFVKEGDVVQAGDTLCLIEVMKTYTDVVAQSSGRIKKVLVSNGAMVESEQALFVIELD